MKMKTLVEIREMLRKQKKELREGFKVKEIGIFGSYVKGKQKNESDIDMVVEFEGESIGSIHLKV